MKTTTGRNTSSQWMGLPWRLIELHVLFPTTGWCSELAKVTAIRSLLGFRVMMMIAMDLTPLYVRLKFNDTFHYTKFAAERKYQSYSACKNLLE
jgi:hypothetical protein